MVFYTCIVNEIVDKIINNGYLYYLIKPLYMNYHIFPLKI